MHLSPLDEYPIHQTPAPISSPATSDRNFYDRSYFNVLDRETCELICTKRSSLFETPLAEMIKTQYEELLDQMVEQRRPSTALEQALMEVRGQDKKEDEV